MPTFFALIAQSVEHAAVNRGVTGSSPVWGAKKKTIPCGWFFFVFIIRIKICGTVWLTDASRAVNCFERDRFRWKKKGARKGAAVKSCPRTKRIATFGHRKSGCHRFKLRLAMLTITLLSLRDISPIRGITCWEVICKK